MNKTIINELKKFKGKDIVILLNEKAVFYSPNLSTLILAGERATVIDVLNDECLVLKLHSSDIIQYLSIDLIQIVETKD